MKEHQAIIDRLEKNGNPVIESDRAIFCWLGKSPPALMADFSGWDENKPAQFTQLAKNLWVHEVELPADSYIEYAFFKAKKRIMDPLNSHTTPNGMGDTNHYFSMPEYKPTPLDHLVKGTPQGRTIRTKFDVHGLMAGQFRSVTLYQPPVKEEVPLVVVYDGNDYLYRTRLPVMVDNLISAGRIKPIALAFIDNSNPYRALEYGCSDTTLFCLKEFFLPFARQKLNLIDPSSSPGAYGVIGASLGGLMALYTVLRHPETFGSALIQSGAFSVNNYHFVIWDLLQKKPKPELKLWLDCGHFEEFIESNQKMAAILKARRYHFFFNEYNGGHNYPSWRNALPAGLEFLFGSSTLADNLTTP